MPYIGKTPLTGAYQLCDAITTSATATYNLTVGGSAVIPGSAQNCIVSLNGVIQAPVNAFTVSGSQITFASALTSTDVIDFILILGNVFDIGTPTNGSVTNSSLNSNVITGQTAVTTPATDDVLLCYDTSATALRKITFANFGNAPALMAFGSSATQSVSSTIWTEATVFKTELFDSDNAFDTSTGRFTPQVAGKYFFTAQVYMHSGAAAGFNGMMITKNGVITGDSTGELFWHTALAVGVSDFRVNGFLTLNGTTDYVSVFINQQTGGTKTIGGGGAASATFFGAYRLIGV